MHACDGQTDGRTDRILIARPRLHCMQRGKNVKNLSKRDNNNKTLSYRRETALQGVLVLAKSGRLVPEDNILRTL